MKRTLNLYILLIVFVCTTLVSVSIFFNVNRLLSSLIDEEKIELKKNIQRELEYYQGTLELIEQQIIHLTKDKLITSANRIFQKWPNLEQVPIDTLHRLALHLKVDQVFLVDNEGIIKKTTLSKELNYDLKQEGEEFYAFFKNLFLTHSFQMYSWGVSSVDNSLNVYSYYVPAESNYAFETSINIQNYLANYKTHYSLNGVFNYVKNEIRKEKEFISAIDLYNLRDSYKASVLNENKELELDAKEWKELNEKGNLTLSTKNGEIYYSIIEIPESNLRLAPQLILQAEFNYSKQQNFIKQLLGFNILILLVILLLVALTSPVIIDNLILDKISIINFNLNALRFAKYDVLKSFKGNDELSAIAENIEHVKDSVLEREKQLNEAKFLAEAADNLKSAFLANMSHEIRTPLNAVVGFAQLLRDASPTPEDVERYVGLITSNSYNLLQLINDIIDLSQIESGQIKIVSRKVYLSKFLDELNSYAQEKLNGDPFIHSEKSIKIVVESPTISQDDCIYTDPFRIRQIMEQLIDNALKFTNKGEVRIGFKISEPFAELFVSDTGVGIADEHTVKIFERFVQVEEYLTRQYGGTGLGLAICYELVHMLKGTIHVDSKLNVGSKFTVKIPYAEF